MLVSNANWSYLVQMQDDDRQTTDIANRASVVRVPDPNWDPMAALQTLVLESALDDHDARATTARLLREHALISAASISHLAVHATSERVRLTAAQYVVDRALQQTPDAEPTYIRDEQVRQVGNAIQSVVRTLSHRYGFDAQGADVLATVHTALSGIGNVSVVDAQVVDAPDADGPVGPDEDDGDL
jgi:hypothetical protein